MGAAHSQTILAGEIYQKLCGRCYEIEARILNIETTDFALVMKLNAYIKTLDVLLNQIACYYDEGDFNEPDSANKIADRYNKLFDSCESLLVDEFEGYIK
jgi:hypothetical protein